VRRPLSLWILVFLLALLALGGFVGSWGFISDPSGKAIGMEAMLPLLPVKSYLLPGIALFVLMFMLPILLIYGVSFRTELSWMDTFTRWTGMHWSWVGTIALGLGLLVWLLIQAAYIGFAAPVQWFTAALDLTIILAASLRKTRTWLKSVK
jgi:hypothetical protein